MSKSLIQLINSDAMKAQFQKTMNSPKMLDRFMRLATSAINQTPRLGECTAQSVVGALLKSAQLNLEPNTIMGHCYLIPRKSKGQWECNFELGYKGQMELARRSDEIGLIEAREVHENDEFDIDYGLNQLTHKPYWRGDRGKGIGYWARYRLKNDPSQAQFEFMTKAQVEEHRDKYSKSKDSEYSPWNTSFDKMAKKTVIKQVLAYAPLSVEDYAHAMAADQTVINAELPVGYKASMSTADILTSGPDESEEQPKAMAIAPKKTTFQPDSSFTASESEQADWQAMFDKVEDRIASRIKNGANPVDLENLIGMSLTAVNDLDSIGLAKAYEALK